MILASSACGARFVVDGSLFGPTGRMVRCGRCQHEWLATKPDDLPEEPPPPPPPPPGPPPKASNLPALRQPPQRSVATMVGWGALIAVLIGFSAALIAHEYVVEAWPGSARYYAWFGMQSAAPPPPMVAPPAPAPAQPVVLLKLRELKQRRISRDGVDFLVVEGRIFNDTDTARDLPTMRGVLLDAANKELQAWTFPPPQPKLGAGENAAFQTELKSPVTGAASLSITFEPAK